MIRAYERRHRDAIEVAYLGASVGATWISQAVWGHRQSPSVDTLTEKLHKDDPKSELSEDLRRASAEFDEMRMRIHLRVRSRLMEAKGHGRRHDR